MCNLILKCNSDSETGVEIGIWGVFAENLSGVCAIGIRIAIEINNISPGLT